METIVECWRRLHKELAAVGEVRADIRTGSPGEDDLSWRLAGDHSQRRLAEAVIRECGITLRDALPDEAPTGILAIRDPVQRWMAFLEQRYPERMTMSGYTTVTDESGSVSIDAVFHSIHRVCEVAALACRELAVSALENHRPVELPNAAVSNGRSRATSPAVNQIRKSVREIYQSGTTRHMDICKALDARKVRTPPRTDWPARSWEASFKFFQRSKANANSVAKWLSVALAEK